MYEYKDAFNNEIVGIEKNGERQDGWKREMRKESVEEAGKPPL